MTKRSRREYRIDCHVHSRFSEDARGSVAEIVAAARAKGLDGVAITDHNTVAAHKAIKELRDPGIIVVPGIEVSTAEGHCLALGVREAVPRDLSLEATIDAIEAAGGVASPSHARRRVHGVGAKAIDRVAHLLSAMEVYNAHDGDGKSHKTELLAINNRLGGTGGSDSHRPEDVGNGYTTIPFHVETVDDVIQAMAAGKTWGEGVPFGRLHHLKKNVRSAGFFARRGFRKI